MTIFMCPSQPSLKGKGNQHTSSGTSSSGHGQGSKESVGHLLQASTANYIRNPDSADRNHNYYTVVINYRPVIIKGSGHFLKFDRNNKTPLVLHHGHKLPQRNQILVMS
jgi:hypothetical protein